MDLDSKNTYTLLDLVEFFYILEWDWQSTQTNLLDLEWVYDILDLDLKSTNLLESDWFYCNQAWMLLVKYENLLQWSVKQLVIQSSLASLIFLGRTIVWCVKNKMLLVVKLGIFRIQEELYKSKCNLIRFKR